MKSRLLVGPKLSLERSVTTISCSDPSDPTEARQISYFYLSPYTNSQSPSREIQLRLLQLSYSGVYYSIENDPRSSARVMSSAYADGQRSLQAPDKHHWRWYYSSWCLSNNTSSSCSTSNIATVHRLLASILLNSRPKLQHDESPGQAFNVNTHFVRLGISRVLEVGRGRS
jgi:hypothetical protein